MPQHGFVDRSTIIELGVLASAALIAAGFLGSWLLADAATVPGWEKSLFLDAEILGTLGLLFFPITFGIVLPLVE